MCIHTWNKGVCIRYEELCPFIHENKGVCIRYEELCPCIPENKGVYIY